MQQQSQTLRSFSEFGTATNSTWLLGACCLIGFAVALCLTVAFGGPGFSDFVSMTVLP